MLTLVVLLNKGILCMGSTWLDLFYHMQYADTCLYEVYKKYMVSIRGLCQPEAICIKVHLVL